MENRIKNENSEVDLRDYIKLIFAKKWLILAVFLVAIAIAGFRIFSSPRIYNLNTWLEIGKIKEGASAELIESPVQIDKKIKNNLYGDFPYSISVLNPEQTNLVQISIQAGNPEQAKNDLEKILGIILADHKEKIKIKRDVLESEIKRLEKNISFWKEETKNLEIKIKMPLSEGELFFVRENLLNKNQAIEEAYSKIGLLKNSLGNISDTQIIKSITVNPVGRKSLINIVVLPGIIGLFLGLSLVFLKKWWDDYKN